MGEQSDEGDEPAVQAPTAATSTSSASSVSQTSRRSLAISTYQVIIFVDALLASGEDSREDRLQKVSAFIIAVFFGVLLVGSTSAAAAVSWWTPLGSTIAFSIACMFLVFAAILVKSKSSRLARWYAHSLSFFFAVLVPAYVTFGTGLSAVDDNGDPHFYQPAYYIFIPALIAYLLQSRRGTFVYSSILFAWICVGPLWNPRGDDLAHTGESFIATLVQFVIVTFCLSMLMDIAETLHTANEAATARTQIAEEEAQTERRANKAKTRFVSVMSHEIRNPLQAILLQLEMLELSKLTKGQRDYVSGITRASNALLAIVNDILEVTKIESGALSLEMKPVLMRDLVEVSVHSYAPAAANKGVELIVNISPVLSTNVVTDPTRLRQVLRNLVSNALKFTEAGEIEVTLEELAGSEACDDDGSVPMWALRVRDTGIGIAEDSKDKLFEEFSQVDETTTRLYGGTGLGLFICKELSEVMGGSVAVESAVGVGSTFSFMFRAARSNDVVQPPVHVVSSEFAWTILVHATNETLRRTIASYAAFFFSGVSDAVTVEFSATVRDGDRRVAELGGACTSGSRRLVVVANYTDCSTKMLTVLSGLPSTRVVPVMLVSPAAALFADESPPAVELPHTVQKPVTLSQLCSAIERAIANEPASPLSRSLSLSVSASSRKLSDGTLTQGARLATSGQMEAATIEQAAARPGHSTVLIADDFELIRSLVQQLVAQQGYNTLVAANGEEAVALVRQHYDVLAMVLMDCEMPEVDGYAATQQIRRYERERGIPPSKQVYVCAMTANAMNDDSKRCFANHMSGFLAKPVSRADLQSKLTEHGRTPTERGIEAIGATRKPKKAKKKRVR